MWLKSFRSCISFDSYIKPQRIHRATCVKLVVYLLIPTSNHNTGVTKPIVEAVVYLLIPTSNHNLGWCYIFLPLVVYLLIPTSNHNRSQGIISFNELYIF